ncbi:MAG: hypothetical protein R3F17_07700 [Planctomycetota bacterium]
MKLITLFAGLAGLAGIAAIPAATDIAFKPKESTTLDKEYSLKLDFALDSMVVTVNGEEMDPAAMGMDLDEATLEMSMNLAFSDEYVSMDGSKVKKLKRTFHSGSAEFEAGSGESDKKDMSELEDETVIFNWNEEKGTYEIKDEEGEDAKEELQVMSIDTDLRVFLPKAGVEVDESWTVGGKELFSVLIPGIDLDKAARLADEKAAEEGDVPFTPSGMLKYLDEMGKVECTYKGAREVDGVTLQVIALKPEIEKSIDLTDLLSGIIEKQAPGQEIEVNLTVTLEGTGNGELLWDAEAGHFRKYDLEMQLSTLVEANGGAQGMTGAVEVEATTNLVYGFTAK